ncbi:MAG TPA: hypothetical protein VF516_26335 [Kofleriaceae bacterium]
MAVVSIIRGIDRIGDGHPASGWIFLASGSAIVAGLVQALRASRSAQRPQASR